MPRGSDNIYPHVLVSEGSAPSASSSGTYPGIASGDQALFIDSADHKLKRVNSSGTVTTIEGSGGGGSLELTDGTTDLTGVTKITTTLLAVGGTSAAATLAAALTTASALLGADVSMPTATTWYDAVSLTLAAGTWLLLAGLTGTNGGVISDITARLYDSTNSANLAHGTGPVRTGTACVSVALAALVSPTGSTTYKLQGASDANTSTIKASSTQNGAGNTATYLLAVRLA